MVALQSNLSRDEQLAAIADIEAFQASRPDDCDQELSTRVILQVTQLPELNEIHL